MRKSTTVAALVGLLALATAPMAAAGGLAGQGPEVQVASQGDDQQAKPAGTDSKEGAAKPAEQPKPTVKPSALTGNYGGGFRLTSNDGRFSIRFMGAAQFRYTYMKYDDEVRGNDRDYSNFYMRRARFWFDGHAYDPRLTYYFHVQLEPQSAVNLHDAWLNFAFKPMLQVGLGRNKIAYGLEFLHSGFGLNMVERSIMYGETDINSGGGYSKFPGGGTEGFPLVGKDANTGFPTGGLALFRSQGVQLSGRTTGKGPVFEYQAGVWQGRDSRGSSNQGTNHLYSGRVGFYPSGYINWLFEGDVANSKTFLTGFLASVFTDTRLYNKDYSGASVPTYEGENSGYNLAAMARYRGFSADLEYGAETYDMKDATLIGQREFDRAGWRAQLGYFLVPKQIEVVGRVAGISRLKDATVEAARNSGLGFAKIRNSNGVFQDAVEKNIREMTVGLNWYLSNSGQQHKFFVDYSHLSREFAGFVVGGTLDGAAPKQGDDRFRAMLQVKF